MADEAPINYRRRALEAADKSDVTRSVMWSLLALADDLHQIASDVRAMRRDGGTRGR